MATGSWQRTSRFLQLAALLSFAGIAAGDHRHHPGTEQAARALLAPATASMAAAVPTPAQLLDGDLVFRRSPDLTTWVIRAQREASRFTHVGMIVHVQGQLFVLHAVPPENEQARERGVRLEPLATFIAPSHSVEHGFYRASALHGDGRRVVRDYALAQLGKPFDERFLYSEDARMFCTEIVMKAYARAGLTAEHDVPRVNVVLHDEGIPTPDDLRRWQGLVALR